MQRGLIRAGVGGFLKAGLRQGQANLERRGPVRGAGQDARPGNVAMDGRFAGQRKIGDKAEHPRLRKVTNPIARKPNSV